MIGNPYPFSIDMCIHQFLASRTSINLAAYYIRKPAAVSKMFAGREYRYCYWQQVRRISFCWQEIRETFSALCSSSRRFVGASSRFDGREYAADSSRFGECPSYSRMFAAAFLGGFRRAAADSQEPAAYSTSWNMRVKQQARNAGLADRYGTY